MKNCKNCGEKIDNDNKFCSGCGTKINGNKKTVHHPHTNNNSKKQKVLERKKKNNYVFIIIAIVFVGILYSYMGKSSSKETKVLAGQPLLANSTEYPVFPYRAKTINSNVSDGKISIDLGEVEQKKFVFFNYKGTAGQVPLLAYITENGKIVTSVRMCEPCNSTSFHIKGANLVCDACGTTWKLENLEAVSGSCGKYPPDPIPSRIEGKNIVIDEHLVANWTRRV
ncbi:MAG: DUF2318 domain-containing protein [Bacteroidetes bacterium]|nr:DUF2318 domain-containing protein [Bacteroidota bacterium]